MKREWVLPAAALGGGVAGFFLRRQQLSESFHPDTGLMDMDSPAMWLLLALTALVLALALLLCRDAGERELTAPERFQAPRTGYITGVVCGALLMLAAAGAGLVELRGGYLDNIVDLVLYLLCAVGGLSALAAGRNTYRRLWPDTAPVLHMGPAFCALVWLVSTYQKTSGQPVLMLYVYSLMAAVTALLALYGLSSLAMGKGGAVRTCLLDAMGVYLCLVSLADGHPLSISLLSLGCAVYLEAQLWMLLRTAYGPAWPRRMPDGAEDEETEETDQI